MKKKLVVVLMAAVMAMTAVTGCGSKADDAKKIHRHLRLQRVRQAQTQIRRQQCMWQI